MSLKNGHKYPWGIVGNCHYLAYVDYRDANIAWMCWPRVDSSFLFGGMLDSEKGGEFKIVPVDKKAKSTQFYLRNTNILVTRFDCSDGVFQVVDFAPRFEHYGRVAKSLSLIRKIELISGNPCIRITCRPTCHYGEEKLRPSIVSNHLRFEGLEAPIRLYSDCSLEHIASGDPFVLNSTSYLCLFYDAHLNDELSTYCEDLLKKTHHYWQSWIRRSSMPLRYQGVIIRSLLALKLHQVEDTGAIIASGTTSLPEYPGEERNWDYRYCWPRDSYYTLTALSSTAHFTEMIYYAQFIQNIAAINKDYQPLYSITGKTRLTENEIPLKGYQDKYGPVRIGNLAYEQKQFDVYGQIVLSLLSFYLDQRLPDEFSPPDTALLEKLLELIEENLERPDSGIWEFRGIEKVHTHTLLFHWAGAKGIAKVAALKGNSELEVRAKALQKKASGLIEKTYDPKKKVYTSAIGDGHLDASSFLLVTMNYLDPKSQKARDHVMALGKELADENGFVVRYKHEDDFGTMKVAFCICGFWYAEALAMIGEITKAEDVFKNHLDSANHLYLLSEDVDPGDRSQWGNFPQTYSHVGAIHCAFSIAQARNRSLFFE